MHEQRRNLWRTEPDLTLDPDTASIDQIRASLRAANVEIWVSSELDFSVPIYARALDFELRDAYRDLVEACT